MTHRFSHQWPILLSELSLVLLSSILSKTFTRDSSSYYQNYYQYSSLVLLTSILSKTDQSLLSKIFTHGSTSYYQHYLCSYWQAHCQKRSFTSHCISHQWLAQWPPLWLNDFWPPFNPWLTLHGVPVAHLWPIPCWELFMHWPSLSTI